MSDTVDRAPVLPTPRSAEPTQPDLRIGGPALGDEECDAVTAVLRSGRLAQGEQVAAFEEGFSAHVAGRPCVAVNSGTSALLLGLLAAGIGPGDEVVVPSFSFAATANAVVLAGASPVFVDIEPDFYGLDPAAVRAAISPRTAGIVPVHLFGHPADMTELSTLARRHGLAIVEDCAQAHLADLDGVPVGTFGAAGAFSFYPTKNMTTGEGGMVTCADEATARRVRLLRNQGMERRYENEIVGYNLRMTEIHAAIGVVQLGRLRGFTDARRRNAQWLADAVRSRTGGVVLPWEAPGARHVWHQFTVRVRERDTVVDDMARRGVHAGVYYPTPIHRLPAYGRALDLPVTELAASQVLSLPAGPQLGAADLDRVARTLAEAVGTERAGA